jgi:hypothetical protein
MAPAPSYQNGFTLGCIITLFPWRDQHMVATVMSPVDPAPEHAQVVGRERLPVAPSERPMPAPIFCGWKGVSNTSSFAPALCSAQCAPWDRRRHPAKISPPGAHNAQRHQCVGASTPDDGAVTDPPGRFVDPPVEVAAARRLWASRATAPTVPCFFCLGGGDESHAGALPTVASVYAALRDVK